MTHTKHVNITSIKQKFVVSVNKVETQGFCVAQSGSVITDLLLSRRGVTVIRLPQMLGVVVVVMRLVRMLDALLLVVLVLPLPQRPRVLVLRVLHALPHPHALVLQQYERWTFVELVILN